MVKMASEVIEVIKNNALGSLAPYINCTCREDILAVSRIFSKNDEELANIIASIVELRMSSAKYGYDADGFNREGMDKDGFNKEGWNASGINKNTGTDLDKEGYDMNGWNKNGWSRDGINKDTKTKYNKDGLDINGLDINGRNPRHQAPRLLRRRRI